MDGSRAIFSVQTVTPTPLLAGNFSDSNDRDSDGNDIYSDSYDSNAYTITGRL